MTAPLGQPTRRVTVVFFAEDCEQLEHRYGYGWTEQVRLIVHDNCNKWKKHKETVENFLRARDGN